ncbi:MAG TPA: hypothetical protein VFQ68_29415, partial [Streptosporangiaceae bacterium]|nr:hypothetical protein [Streptosporangiaceae bacterium]
MSRDAVRPAWAGAGCAREGEARACGVRPAGAPARAPRAVLRRGVLPGRGAARREQEAPHAGARAGAPRAHLPLLAPAGGRLRRRDDPRAHHRRPVCPCRRPAAPTRRDAASSRQPCRADTPSSVAAAAAASVPCATS